MRLVTSGLIAVLLLETAYAVCNPACNAGQFCVTAGANIDTCVDDGCIPDPCPLASEGCTETPCTCTPKPEDGTAQCNCALRDNGDICDMGADFWLGECNGVDKVCKCDGDDDCENLTYCDGAETCNTSTGECQKNDNICYFEPCIEAEDICDYCNPNPEDQDLVPVPCTEAGTCRVLGSPACTNMQPPDYWECNIELAPEGTDCGSSGGKCSSDGFCSQCSAASECSDNVFCNGEEVCSDNRCSAATELPCSGDCNEAKRTCGDDSGGLSPAILILGGGAGLLVVITGVGLVLRNPGNQSFDAFDTPTSRGTAAKSVSGETYNRQTAAFSESVGGDTSAAFTSASTKDRSRGMSALSNKRRPSTKDPDFTRSLGIGDSYIPPGNGGVPFIATDASSGGRRPSKGSGGIRTGSRGSKASRGSSRGSRASSGGGKKHRRPSKGSRGSHASGGKTHRKGRKKSTASGGRSEGFYRT